MYSFATYKEQYKANLRLALPVVLTQLGQILTQVADNLMVGRYGGSDPTPLAAVSFGGAVFFILFIVLSESHSRIRISRFHGKLFKYSLVIYPIFFQNSCSKIITIFQDSQQYMFRISCYAFQQTCFKHTHLQYLGRHRGQRYFSVRQESIVLSIFQETLQTTFYPF